MAEEDRRISLAGKVLVNKIDAQLLEVQKQGQVVGCGVALTMEPQVSGLGLLLCLPRLDLRSLLMTASSAG